MKRGDLPIELVFFEGCPNAGQARVNLRAALERTGLVQTWTERDLDAPDVATRLRPYASPTVLVDGVDVTGGAEPSRSGAGGRACRSDGAPSTDQIVRAIEKARSGANEA